MDTPAEAVELVVLLLLLALLPLCWPRIPPERLLRYLLNWKENRKTWKSIYSTENTFLGQQPDSLLTSPYIIPSLSLSFLRHHLLQTCSGWYTGCVFERVNKNLGLPTLKTHLYYVTRLSLPQPVKYKNNTHNRDKIKQFFFLQKVISVPSCLLFTQLRGRREPKKPFGFPPDIIFLLFLWKYSRCSFQNNPV